MKQFQYTSRHGYVSGPFSEDDVRGFHEGTKGALTLLPGQTWMDSDGDVWSCADAGEEPTATVDDRLERIATEAMAAIIARNSRIVAPYEPTATMEYQAEAHTAVAYAKALIAELDAAK